MSQLIRESTVIFPFFNPKPFAGGKELLNMDEGTYRLVSSGKEDVADTLRGWKLE